MDIRLAARLTIDSAERSLSEHDVDQHGSLRIDLSDCQEIDVVALLYVVAVTSRRAETGLVTRFTLPIDSTAREYIRRRGFPAAIENVADVPFRLLVDDNWFHQDDVSKSAGDNFTDASSAILAYLDECNFFSFSHYDLLDVEDRAPIIEREGRRWLDPLIVELLSNRLTRRNASDISRVVVREMLANLMHHTETGDVVCISNVDESHSSTQPGLILTIAAWYSPTVRSNTAAVLFDRLMATINQPGRREAVSLGWEMDQSSQEPPMPTDTTAEAFPLAADDLIYESNSFEALYAHVVNEFHGSLDVRSGEVSAELVREAGTETSYRINIRNNSHTADTGAIIAVRLPLHHD